MSYIMISSSSVSSSPPKSINLQKEEARNGFVEASEASRVFGAEVREEKSMARSERRKRYLHGQFPYVILLTFNFSPSRTGLYPAFQAFR